MCGIVLLELETPTRAHWKTELIIAHYARVCRIFLFLTYTWVARIKVLFFFWEHDLNAVPVKMHLVKEHLIVAVESLEHFWSIYFVNNCVLANAKQLPSQPINQTIILCIK